MADVVEITPEEVQAVEKDEKKVEEVDEDSKVSENGEEEKPKENGNAENGHKEEEDVSSNNVTEVTAPKRKSGAGDATDGPQIEGASPEKKAKISTEETEKAEEATNGEETAVA